MISCPRLTIAGLGGDTGKTAISVGLCRFLRDKGHRVTPFKKGPDYIDMEWLSRAAGHPCYNVDLFLMSKEQALSSFSMHTRDADIAVIEGNRGLYDGMDAEGSVSTAEIAKLLSSPVIIIVDCTKVTRTVAALVLGCQTLDSQVPIKGVILNRLAGSRHETVIRKSIEHYCGIPVVGSVPKLKDIQFPGRHLGLVPPQEHSAYEDALRNSSVTIGKYVEMDRIWDIARNARPVNFPDCGSFQYGEKRVNIGVIRDAAFQFYYPENLDALKRAGANLIEFSALTDVLPRPLDALYIGGGFPETHASALSENARLRHEIKVAAERGLPIYAECGGLMYLSRELAWDGKIYPMAGVLPADIVVSKKPRGHGYTILEVTTPNPFFATGKTFHGHEFHYSYVHSMDETVQCHFAFKVLKGEGIMKGMEGVCCGNVLATYSHLHATGTPEWVQGMVKAASSYKETYY